MTLFAFFDILFSHRLKQPTILRAHRQTGKMDNNTAPAQFAPGYPSPVPAAQPVVRKLVRKAIGNPSSGQEQHPTLTPGTSRSASVDISAFYQQGSQSYAPELHRSNTANSPVSSGRDSVFSNNAPLSPLTNVTTPSPLASPFQSDNRLSLGYAAQAVAPLPSPLAICAGCTGGRFKLVHKSGHWN